MEVRFKMTNSKNMIHSPSKGAVRTVIPPKGLVYLASSILDPGSSSFSYSYSFAANKR